MRILICIYNVNGWCVMVNLITLLYRISIISISNEYSTEMPSTCSVLWIWRNNTAHRCIHVFFQAATPLSFEEPLTVSKIPITKIRRIIHKYEKPHIKRYKRKYLHRCNRIRFWSPITKAIYWLKSPDFLKRQRMKIPVHWFVSLECCNHVCSGKSFPRYTEYPESSIPG